METQNKKSILRIPLLLLVGVVLFSFGVGAVSATNTSSNSTIYVSTDGDDTWDGLSPVYNTTSGPKKTITNATGTVTVNGTVYIAPGTYTESGIVIDKDMTITGENQKNTIINGQQSGHSIFTIVSGITVNINNLTLTNNTANTNGGAIYNKGSLAVTNCTFTNNTANTNGGTIYNDGGRLAVTNCTFTKNTASRYGGAIANGEGSLTVIKCTFTNNTIKGTGYGGVIWSYAGSLTVINCTFTNNSAVNGGAIFTSGGLTVTNCTFTNNSANYLGGAIFTSGGLTVTNCTFTNNSANYGGGAIYNIVDDGFSVVVHFNRIVGNSPSNSQIYSQKGIVDARFNWWGSNLNPSGYVNGNVDVSSWLVLNVTANPDNIFYGGNSTVSVDLLHDNTGTYHDPVNGHVPDGIVVDFASDLGKPVSAVLVNGSATYLFKATTLGSGSITATVDNQKVSTPITINQAPTGVIVDPVSGFAGQNVALKAHVMDSYGNAVKEGQVTFRVDGTVIGSGDVSNGLATISWIIPSTWTSGVYNITAEYSGSSNYFSSVNGTFLMLEPSAYLYMNVTNSKVSPGVGDKFVLTYKLSNGGPDNAANVVVSFRVPEGLEFVSASVDSGTCSYNPANRMVTWTLSNVEVGDPYLYLTLRALGSGKYTILPVISSDTFNRNTDALKPFSIDVESQNNGNNGSNDSTANSTVVDAASSTVVMHNTGMPLVGFALAILAVLGGIFAPRKK